MKTLELILILSFGILFYTYIGYGLICWVLVKLKKQSNIQALDVEDLPEVTHIIAAYNEEDIIQDKINNCQLLSYPKEKIRTIIVTDGSSDGTVDIVKNNKEISLFHKQERSGKLAAVNRVMGEVKSPITIFSDANAMLNVNAIKEMVKHFQFNTVGGVAGEKVVLSEEEDDASAAGEGIYWKYESFLKKLDYKLHSVVGAAGELFAVRTELYETPDKDTLIEDFVTTLRIAQKGYRVAYEPNAKAKEYASSSLDDELKRKVRISAGGLQAIWMLRTLLNPFKYKMLHFQYVSHRVLRWTLAPLALPVVFICSFLLAKTGVWYYEVLFGAQALFYLAALGGYYFERVKTRFKIFFIPFYFMFMNLSVYLGLIKLMLGSYSVNWEKANRRVVAQN
ncbi:glycosyltransferase family 2 protein [Ekhidna sp.]|uniref:glycosyltransferase family 2 protein n=1 Tax=Ekhidna sp. TaxID=2608089 RepID=UPI003CCC0754